MDNKYARPIEIRLGYICPSLRVREEKDKKDLTETCGLVEEDEYCFIVVAALQIAMTKGYGPDIKR